MKKTENTKQFYSYQERKMAEYREHIIKINKLNPVVISEDLKCPHCGSERDVKNGITCNRQRYKCSNIECKRTFSISTNTSIHKLQKVEKWTNFI